MHATGWSRGLEVTGGGTGVVSHAGLVLLRARRRAHASAGDGLQGARRAAEQTLHEIARETRRRLSER